MDRKNRQEGKKQIKSRLSGQEEYAGCEETIGGRGRGYRQEGKRQIESRLGGQEE